MESGFRRKIWLVYLLALLVGIGFSMAIYWENRNVATATMTLVNKDVATLGRLARLKVSLASEERKLYQFYITGEAHSITTGYGGEFVMVEAGIGRLRNTFRNNPQFSEIESRFDMVKRVTYELDRIWQSGSINSDRERNLLGFLEKSAELINSDLDFLAGMKEKNIAERETLVQEMLERSNLMFYLLAAIIFLLSIFAGLQLNAFLSESWQGKKLAIYPEHNPNPILGLSAGGEIIYANPSARDAMRILGIKSIAELLPENWLLKLSGLQAPGRDIDKWEYPVSNRIFDCKIHYSPDYGIFHAYLADITHRKQAEDNLLYQAYHDPLTGLPNRRAFQERLEAGIATGDELAILLFNLDRFRLIIESLGHHVGDRLLQSVALRLNVPLQDGAGILYRCEGDLFAMLLPRMKSFAVAVALAEQVAGEIRKPFAQDGREYFFTLSIGAAIFPRDGLDAVTLLKNAESALHQVRKAGGNGIKTYDLEMNSHALERLEMENFLRQAEAGSQFELHYQPQLDISSGKIIGAEALIRWNHPELGLVQPNDFIPLAEENGLILSIGGWVLKTACHACKKWGASGFPIKVAVNVSARQFLGGDLPQRVRAALLETGLEAEYLELEVTESVAMYDVDATVAILNELKEIGVNLSIDDFGTGYSSLSYLQRFPIDKLKIDRSFMNDMAHDPALVQAIVSLGKSLDLVVIAEGVETDGVLEQLAAFDCDEAQGYLISKPLNIADFSSFAEKNLSSFAQALPA